VFTLRLTLLGRAIEPTEHESFADLGDTLARVLSDAGMGLNPRVISILQSLIFSDLRTHSSWTWVAEDYEIFVSRDGP
jgi:hypothetical protein